MLQSDREKINIENNHNVKCLIKQLMNNLLNSIIDKACETLQVEALFPIFESMVVAQDNVECLPF